MSNRLVIHLDRLAANLTAVRQALGGRTEMIHVVKANAYGHGLVEAARTGWGAGIRRFAVAYLEEALAIRSALPEAWILVLGVVWGDAVPTCLRERIVPVVVDDDHVGDLAAGVPVGQRLEVHLKVDTGMNRLGWTGDHPVDGLRRALANPRLQVSGIMSHLASAGPGGLAEIQADRFRSILSALPPDPGLLIHFANSQGIQFGWGTAFTGVRTGLLSYGYRPGPGGIEVPVRPVLEWRAEVLQVKDVPKGSLVGYDSTYRTTAPTRIATLSAGYADGYPRGLGNRGVVVLAGRRCPVIGRVSMNWTTVDAGLDSPVRRGDEAILIGEADGVGVDAAELAELAGAIPYEILTRAGCGTAPRSFVGMPE